MKNQFRQSQHPDKKIEEIIIALGTYALGDIKYNIYGSDDCDKKEPKPIAAFILCSCFIDQMAAFAYNYPIGENEKYYKKFISKFLPTYYRPLKLYTKLRNLLIHGYSIGEYLSLSIEDPLPPLDDKTISATHITANRLYQDLFLAFEKLKKELLSNTDIRKNALEKYDKHPPLTEVNHGFIKYSKEEADYLIGFYHNDVVGKYMNENKTWKISNITKKKIDKTTMPYLVLCVSKHYGENHVMHIDKITQQFGLVYPIQALKDAGLHQEYITPEG